MVDRRVIWSQLKCLYAKSNYDRLRIDKALGFRKSDNNEKRTKYNVCSYCHFRPVPGPKKIQ